MKYGFTGAAMNPAAIAPNRCESVPMGEAVKIGEENGDAAPSHCLSSENVSGCRAMRSSYTERTSHKKRVASPFKA